MALPPARARLLAAVAAGNILKVHRTADGEKVYRLHWLENEEISGGVEEVAASDVESLLTRGLIASNMKFPAATFLLTDKGLALTQGAGEEQNWPVRVQRYQE